MYDSYPLNPLPVGRRASMQAINTLPTHRGGGDDMTPTTKQPAAPRKVGRMESKYQGRCAWCGQEFEVGQPIYFIEGVEGNYDSTVCVNYDAKLNGTQLDCDYGANDPRVGNSSPPPISPSTGTTTRSTGIYEGLSIVEAAGFYTTGYRDGFLDGSRKQ